MPNRIVLTPALSTSVSSEMFPIPIINITNHYNNNINIVNCVYSFSLILKLRFYQVAEAAVGVAPLAVVVLVA